MGLERESHFNSNSSEEFLQSNNLAPEVSLVTTDGAPISLAETWQSGQNVLLVFLRHLG